MEVEAGDEEVAQIVVGAAVHLGVIVVAAIPLVDLTEAADHPHPELIHTLGTRIPMTTTTGHTHQGYPQMIGTPMTERGGYLP